MTKQIWEQEKSLRNKKYGDLDDWVVLYSVWVDEAGKVEHDARRILRRYQSLRMYWKDGRRQKGREIVKCSFSTAFKALSDSIGNNEQYEAKRSSHCDEYEFRREQRNTNQILQSEPTTIETLSEYLTLFIRVDDLLLSVRSANSLINDNIIYIGDLVQKTEAEILRSPHYERKSLNELKEVLEKMGLHFGMEVPDWPPENVDESYKWLQSPFLKRVDEFELSVRSANCLKNDNIVYVGDLVQKTKAEMFRVPNFGVKSIYEIEGVLARLGLRFGMEVPGWRPDNIEELSKIYDTYFWCQELAVSD